MATTEQILERVDAEIGAGRTWRAKEILRGNIASGVAAPRILERYGQLLESLGDRMEAGKYLYLSGGRRPEYGEAIATFLRRQANAKPAAFAARLPNAVRRCAFSELPAAVQEDLKARGVHPSLFGKRREKARAQPRRWYDPILLLAAILIIIFFFAALVRGGWGILRDLFG